MRSFKELATEAKKKEMIRVKLGKKKKKIGHVITSPGKDGKPGKVLKRKGMPGKKDIGEVVGDNLPTILKAFKKEWDAVKRGKEDIGSPKMSNFYNALFDYFVTSGEMPYGTAKARTGDPYEWIHDRLMDESVTRSTTNHSSFLSENLAYLADRSGKKVFVVSDRNTTGMRGTQDKFSMSVVDAKSGKLIKHFGSHPSLKGAIKFGVNRGFTKKVQGPKGPASKIEYTPIKMKYNQTYTDLQKKMKYDIESVVDVDEGGFNVKGGSIPSNAEIKAFYEKQKGSHSQKIAATKKHFGLQKMTVSAKGNVSAKGIRDETYAPGNTSTKRNPDFDERQGMFNSNYKRINGRSPTKDELRAAGVGKGGDNPKGVKAWKAAMAKLKASEGRK